jgi:hypothetical protein
MPRMKDDENLRILSMGKAFRVTAIFTSDDEANAYMAKHDNDAVIACVGGFVFLANKYDNGEDWPKTARTVRT